MFTGLVECLGRVDRADEEGAGRRLTIAWPRLDAPLAIGESVAVNGCCLTVVASAGDAFELQGRGPRPLIRTNLDAASGPATP